MRHICVCLLCIGFLGEVTFSAEPTDCKPTLPDDQYVLGSDSEVHAGVPEGKVTEFWLKDSKVYPGFEHRIWVYVPAQYDGKSAIPLMMFLDGTEFVARDGSFRVPVVLNNLIANKELPVMAAVFVDPGEAPRRLEYEKAPDGSPLTWPTYLASRFNNRSVEYEVMNSRYADFLASEVLREAQRKGKVRITDDANGRGLAGMSSGGTGAFTVAWFRPHQFRKVFSAIGYYPTTFRGAPGFPQLVQRSEREPLRLFFQDGSRDTSLPEFGVGAERHQALLAVLKEKGYDYEYTLGEGTHNPAHAASIFPQAMRWLWRDYPR